MEFIQNKGQWHSNVEFKSEFTTGAFFLEKKGFTVLLHNPQDLKSLFNVLHGHDSELNPGQKKIPEINNAVKLRSFAYKVKFLGANGVFNALPEKPITTHNNYFLGNDKSKWAADCKLYQSVLYINVYPNIDVRYYSNGGKLKYDFIVRPGGNPNAIAMRYDGPTLSINNKQLVIRTSVGEVTELEPYAYTRGDAKPMPLSCKYVIKDNVVSFDVREYDRTKTMVIDPSIIFATFTGSTSDNWGYTATPGPDGSFFAGGVSFGAGYPVSPGSFDQTFNGGTSTGNAAGFDMAIFKFSPNGSNRIYATYIGGSGNEQPHSMISDGSGNLVIAGASNSDNYPTVGTQLGPRGGFDIVITKLNATGSALLGSVKIGGTGDDGINIRAKSDGATGAVSLRRNYGDDARSEVILDGANNIILSSCTRSNNFPVENSTIQIGSAGLQDGVILKYDASLSTLLFSTYFGGSGDDACFVASINPANGNIYIGGATNSTSRLPGSTTSVISATNSGLEDGFVTIIQSNGGAAIKTTFIGTSEVDILFGLKFDKFGFPYIMGTTKSSSWPVINAAYSDAGAKQFIAKLQPDLSAYIYSTVFGNNSADPNISPIAFLVDRCQNVYVSGWGGGLNVNNGYSTGTTTGLPNTNPLAGIQQPDGRDFYFFVLERNAQSRLFASHYGQFGGLGDHVDGGTSRFDENGVIYQALCANCGRNGSFPTTGGVWASINGSSNCNQAAVKIEMNFGGVGAKVESSIKGDVADTSACIGDIVDFRDLLAKAKTYIWDFGDNTPRVVLRAPNNAVRHAYAAPGVYTVMLIAEDSSTCNIRDTAYKYIKIGDNKAALNFNAAKLPPCESLSYQFTNTSTATSPNFSPKSFVWDYGDGSPRDSINGFAPNPTSHTYTTAGQYVVKLFLFNDNFCNSPDSIMQTIRINPTVKAIFKTDALGCAPYLAMFKNLSLAGTSFQWQFSDGTIFSTQENPTFLFTTPGTFRVRLIANDPSTCNLTDTSAFFTINILPKPVAFASWSPNPPIENVPVTFTNGSSLGAVKFLWYFGDGDSSTLVNPVHEYNATGTYNAQLIAFNQLNCSDTFDLQVSVVVLPVVDVPNAFTPGKFGINAVVKVRGFGITKMEWRIYNRWGQVVFVSTNKNSGWDGRLNGKLQPLDVYAYTLDVELADGQRIRKTGDITLLR